MRRYSPIDQVIIQLTHFLKPLAGDAASQRPNPAEALDDRVLTPDERRLSTALMRINHAGEICAQALYQGQAAMTRNAALKAHFKQAAAEEVDHLQWCQDRITDMGGQVSRLTPLWQLGALGIGRFAGLFGDAYSLGFLAETEHQVSAHLSKHLERLPLNDLKSRTILQQMRQDEEQHAYQALEHGGKPLPQGIRLLMTISAKIMTSIAFYI